MATIDVYNIMKETHTILLIQIIYDDTTKTWKAFDSIYDMLSFIFNKYEEYLQVQDKNKQNYNRNDIFLFIDSLYDISCLVYTNYNKSYKPYSRDWIKMSIEILLNSKK